MNEGLQNKKWYSKYGIPKFYITSEYDKVPIIGIEEMTHNEIINQVNMGKGFTAFECAMCTPVFSIKTIEIYFSNDKALLKRKKIKLSIITSFSFLVMAILFYIMDFTSVFIDKDSNSIFIRTFFGLWFGILTLIPLTVIISNLRGGTDVTETILSYIEENKTTEYGWIS